MQKLGCIGLALAVTFAEVPVETAWKPGHSRAFYPWVDSGRHRARTLHPGMARRPESTQG